MLSKLEKEYLRGLALRVKDIADDDKWQEKRALWKHKNSLQKTRPLILCTLPDEAWMEILPKKNLFIQDDFLKTYEWYLLKQIYRAEHIKDDEIIGDTLYVPISYRFSDWMEGRRRPYTEDGKHAEKFHPVLHEYDDLKKLKKPELISIDEKETEEHMDMLVDAVGDILTVKCGAPLSADTDSYVKGWGYSLIDILCELRGLENIFIDLMLTPEFVHEAMDFLCRGVEEYMDIIEANNLLRLNNNGYVMNSNTPLGSNGLSITDELPCDGYNGDIGYRDLWGYCMAQEFSEVSPEMHAAFVLPYQKRLAKRFGLLSYGCCESNDKKWDNIFGTFDNLREVSVSHCANIEIAAEKIKNKYVLSWKPNCTVIVNFDEDIIVKNLRKGFEVMKDCHLICCLRDNITLCGEPKRAEIWTDIAMKLANEYE